MTQEQVLEIYRKSNALLQGHFKLRSGLHSDKFLQSAAALQYPNYATKICKALAEKIVESNPCGGFDLVIGPAIGGVILAHEVAKSLDARAIFGEKACPARSRRDDKGGAKRDAGTTLCFDRNSALGSGRIPSIKTKMFLRTGFEINPGEKIVIVDDVLTRGTSVAKLIKLIERSGGRIVTSAFIIDRSGGNEIFNLPKISLVNIDIPTYQPEECPMCKADVPLVEP